MGLSRASVGIKSVDCGLVIKKRHDDDKVIALAGNPNVGKSTVFNQLTGLNQHTGNWPGKTVTNAQGFCAYEGQGYMMVDIPGCYSLMAHSTEEEVARDFICFEEPDGVVVVCDATCLERNLNLVLQILEVQKRAVVCVNLMDEAKKKKIHLDLDQISEKIGVPVIGVTARSNKGLEQIFKGLEVALKEEQGGFFIEYPSYIEDAIVEIDTILKKQMEDFPHTRWLSARLLDSNENLLDSVKRYLGHVLVGNEALENAINGIKTKLLENGISQKQISDDMAAVFIKRAEWICKDAITFENKSYNKKDRILDRLFTSKLTGFPIMFFMLLGIFWVTITGANYPSELLSKGLFWVEDYLVEFLIAIGSPQWLYEMLVYGVYRVLAWIIAVMLPPMAIFFPLFTLLEDFGYLPRVAFNLDRCFKRCCACGKQALTMCMECGSL